MAKKFNRTTINFWLDVFLLCNFLLLCWIAVVLRYVFPPAGSISGWSLWGLDYLVWSDLQFGTLCVMVFAVLLHVMLHWSWVCGVIANWRNKSQGKKSGAQADTGTRTLWGVGLMIAILNVLGVGIAVAALTVQGPTN